MTHTAPYADLIHMPEDTLLAGAEDLRRRAFGDDVSLCAIINARSGRCQMDCHFCAQSGHYDSGAPTFPLLTHAQLRARLAMLAPFPIQRVGIVTSGGALAPEDVEQLVAFFTEMSGTGENAANNERKGENGDENESERWRGRLCASLGRLDAHALQRLREAGIVRYHHNLESSEAFYPRICSTQSWEQRRDTVTRAHVASMSVCCGGIFGLGESWEERISLALALKSMGVRHVPMNFLHPQAGTPLASQAPLCAAEALRIIAIFRHILPEATLRICGGARLVLQERRPHIFAAGANALMVGDYLTTQGKTIEDDISMIGALGLKIRV